MKMYDVVPKMSKLYLNRIVGSFLKDVKLTTEEEMREVILKNVAEFQNTVRVKHNLNFTDEERNIDVLVELILICLIECDDYVATSTKLATDVLALEERIISDSRNEKYVASAIPEDGYRIYSPVLTAAWDKDESLNAHEKNILQVLRNVLQLTRRHHRLIESRIGRFPQNGNKLHAYRQIDEALKALQNRGLILRFKTDDEYYVIPEEIARTVRYDVGGELKVGGYKNLLNNLRVDQLKEVLAHFGLISSGTKAELVGRVIHYDRLPSMVLDLLSTADLTDILRRLAGPRISGTKDEKIQTIIDFYESITTPKQSDPTDDRARFYDSFEELADRDYASLRGNSVISKDIDIDNFFERATDYLFEKKLEILPVKQGGSRHADGRLKYNSTESILWDNKSTEEPYTFPQSHFDQFLGYIRSEPMRPTLFIVIVGQYTSEAVSKTYRLKAESDTDTDVSLITASDLKFVAENWKSYSGKKQPVFDLEVFNMTGALTRDILTDRMSWILG